MNKVKEDLKKNLNRFKELLNHWQEYEIKEKSLLSPEELSAYEKGISCRDNGWSDKALEALDNKLYQKARRGWYVRHKQLRYIEYVKLYEDMLSV